MHVVQALEPTTSPRTPLHVQLTVIRYMLYHIRTQALARALVGAIGRCALLSYTWHHSCTRPCALLHDLHNSCATIAFECFKKKHTAVSHLECAPAPCTQLLVQQHPV